MYNAYKRTLAANQKSSPCEGSGFPLSLSECSFTICLTPHKRKQNVLSHNCLRHFSQATVSIKISNLKKDNFIEHLYIITVLSYYIVDVLLLLFFVVFCVLFCWVF